MNKLFTRSIFKICCLQFSGLGLAILFFLAPLSICGQNYKVCSPNLIRYNTFDQVGNNATDLTSRGWFFSPLGDPTYGWKEDWVGGSIGYNMYVNRNGIHNAVYIGTMGNPFILCAGQPKYVYFDFYNYNWGEGSLEVMLGGQVLATINLLSLTSDYTIYFPGTSKVTLSGTSVSSGHYVGWSIYNWKGIGIEVPTYTGTTNELTFRYMLNGISRHVYIDNVAVYEILYIPPNPTATTLQYCPGYSANLNSLLPATTALTGSMVYQWHTVATNPSAATLVTDPAHVTAGTYFLYVYSSCNDCYSDAADQSVTVSVYPSPQASILGTATVCPGALRNIIFTGSGGTAPYTFFYKLNSGTEMSITPTTGNTATIAANTSATSTYTLTKVKDRYCETVLNTSAKVSVMKISAQNTCMGNNVTFSQADGMAGGTWTVSGGGTINAGTGVFTPATPGCFTVTYTNPSPNNVACSANFVVFPAALAPVITSAHNEPIVVQAPKAYTDFDIQYSFDNGATWGANTPSTADNCTGYNIKIRYVLKNACGSNLAGASIACAESPATTWVLDKTKPSFNAPATAFSFCVHNIQQAGFDNTLNDITPERPEYYTFVKGNTDFDLNTKTFTDACCTSGFTIHWQIDFSGGTPASISGTGQPSAYNADIRFAGDGVNFQNKTHAITYWITDCNGNDSDKQKVNIIIKPRPKIENK